MGTLAGRSWLNQGGHLVAMELMSEPARNCDGRGLAKVGPVESGGAPLYQPRA